MALTAIQQIRRLRGGAQSHLMLASDGNLYVVKFTNNPQHIRVLANELMATRLAAAVGLTVPHSDVIDVTEWLIRNTPDLSIHLRGGAQPCRPGLQFASRWVGGLMPGRTVDILPKGHLLEVRNLQEFAGMVALDKWTGNINGRQAVFERKPRELRYRATFIDQGYCFGAGDWSFTDASLCGVYNENTVYLGVTGWESFEPWLSRIENLDPDIVWPIGEIVPPEWYGGDVSALEGLLKGLLARRSRVRDLITGFGKSARRPFPNWEGLTQTPPTQGFPESAWMRDIKQGSGLM